MTIEAISGDLPIRPLSEAVRLFAESEQTMAQPSPTSFVAHRRVTPTHPR